MLRRLIMANAIYYSLPSIYYVECLLLAYAFYWFYTSLTYCVECLLLQLTLNSLYLFITVYGYLFYVVYCIMAYAFNFLIICLWCANCIFNFCIVQSMLLSLFCANMAYTCANGSGYRQWSRETKGMDTNIEEEYNRRKGSRNICIAV